MVLLDWVGLYYLLGALFVWWITGTDEYKIQYNKAMLELERDEKPMSGFGHGFALLLLYIVLATAWLPVMAYSILK